VFGSIHNITENKLLNEAIEYDKLKTEFFANISHELRTPLSVMLASTQLLQLYGKSDTEINLRNNVDKTALIVRQNIYRLTRLINNLIDITKVDTGFFELQLHNYNIVSIIEDITMSVVDYIENKNISIQFDTDIEEKIISCDADKIERVMLNLLSNSVKFTNPNGSIIVKVSDGEKFVTISVKDTGIGIHKDKQEMIFQRFRQVDKSLSRSNEGSGIGLSLVKSLVELHGGTIKVESVYGFGSEFIIQLPVTKVEANLTDEKFESFEAKKTNIEFSDIY
jgi:two-component system, OmpR family, phosphate regulon sensor histidine kinase PhoR